MGDVYTPTNGHGDRRRRTVTACGCCGARIVIFHGEPRRACACHLAERRCPRCARGLCHCRCPEVRGIVFPAQERA